MIANGPERLCITYERVNSEIYKEIFNNFMVPSSEDLCDGNFIFLHDSASFKRSVSTKNWHRQPRNNVFTWPVYFSDLNPVQNS